MPVIQAFRGFKSSPISSKNKNKNKNCLKKEFHKDEGANKCLPHSTVPLPVIALNWEQWLGVSPCPWTLIAHKNTQLDIYMGKKNHSDYLKC